MKRMLVTATLAAATLASGLSRADEGMWTFNNFPAAAVQEKYGFTPTQAWLDHARLSSVRLTGSTGCSGAIVSPAGLVITNHHCAHTCIAQLSQAKRDYLATGFYAPTAADEAKCPEIEINQLIAITDVTDRLKEATRGLSGAEYAEKLKSETRGIESACAGNDPGLRCDVVTLYRGGRYDLYKYRRFQDVRLVMAPEASVGFFGGYTDNFSFPRFSLDMSFLRIYENGKPLDTAASYLPIGPQAKEGELIFVSGNPGSTSRLMTVAQLEYERGERLPTMIAEDSELRGRLLQLATQGPEKKRIAETALFNIENGIKARRGQLQALTSPAFFQQVVDQERELKRRIAADPKLQAQYGSAWDSIAEAMKRFRTFQDDYNYFERMRGFRSTLFDYARSLVRAPEELSKSKAGLPALRQKVLSTAPLYDELEITTLAFSLEKLREAFGNDDPRVRELLDNQNGLERATALVKGTRLKEPKVRQALLEGGATAMAACTDPMVVFAKRVEVLAQEAKHRYENEVDPALRKGGEAIAQARFALDGAKVYPDATFTPRLAYGSVKGWTNRTGKEIPPFTTFGCAFARATGSEPLRLPKSWIDARSRIAPETRLNLVSTADTIGGNSGSPWFNSRGELVGLNFDRNMEGLSGDYGYDASMKRAVAVDIAAILEALDKIYKADRVVKELKPSLAEPRS